MQADFSSAASVKTGLIVGVITYNSEDYNSKPVRCIYFRFQVKSAANI
jgi:hypothetical protein